MKENVNMNENSSMFTHSSANMNATQAPLYRLVIDYDPYPQNPRDMRYCENFGHMICFHRRYKLGDEHPYASPAEFLSTLLEEALDNPIGNLRLMQFIIDGGSKHAHLSYDKSLGTFNLARTVHADGEIKNENSSMLAHSSANTREYVASCRADDVRNDQDFALAMFDTMSLSEIVDFLRERYTPVLIPLYLYDHSGITISTAPFSDKWDSGMVGYIYCTHDEIVREFGACTEETIAKARAALESEVKVYDAYLRGDVYMYTLYLGDEEIDGCCGFIGDLSEILSELGSILPADATTFTVDISNTVGFPCAVCS